MSEKIFSVAIHYGTDQRGYITYNAETKTAKVVLPEEAWVKKVEEYLGTSHEIDDAVGLSDYKTVTINPLESVDNFKLALTRMWEVNEVHVDWSWPVEEL